MNDNAWAARDFAENVLGHGYAQQLPHTVQCGWIWRSAWETTKHQHDTVIRWEYELVLADASFCGELGECGLSIQRNGVRQAIANDALEANEFCRLYFFTWKMPVSQYPFTTSFRSFPP